MRGLGGCRGLGGFRSLARLGSLVVWMVEVCFASGLWVVALETSDFLLLATRFDSSKLRVYSVYFENRRLITGM